MTDTPHRQYLIEILAEDMAEKADDYYWSLLTPEEREPYYEKARVVFDTLQLAEEQRVVTNWAPVPNSPYAGHKRPKGTLDESRLVSPWVVVEGEKK